MATEVLIVIPARGGSKGIPRKNLRIIGGRPLIAHSIAAAKESGITRHVVVSTDNDEIARIAAGVGAQVVRRPGELGLDNVPLDPVVYDALLEMERRCGFRFEIVLTVQPTSPLLTSTTLREAYDRFVSSDADTLVSVTPQRRLFWTRKDGKYNPFYDKRENRQLLEPVMLETGAFVISKRESISASTRFGTRVLLHEMPKEEALDIDDAVDWQIADSLLSSRIVVFVVSANRRIGYGHAMRSVAIADHMWSDRLRLVLYDSDKEAQSIIENRGYKPELATESTLVDVISSISPNILINDFLDTDINYIKKVKELGCFVVNFEDLGEGAEIADLVFNALYERVKPACNQRFGPEYFVPDERFLNHKPIGFKDRPECLLATFGGVDQNNLTERIAVLSKQIVERSPIDKVAIVIGHGYEHEAKLREICGKKGDGSITIFRQVDNMATIMETADLAVTSNGRTIYELALMGVPTLSIAQNDRETLHSYARYNRGVRYLGIASSVTDETIVESIAAVANGSEMRRRMHQSQLDSSAILRHGQERVISDINSSYDRWKYGRIQAW